MTLFERRYPHQTKRKRQKSLATPPWADLYKIALVYSRARNISRNTGVPHVVDHIIPITHPEVCGLHTPDNLRVVSQKQNGRKHNQWKDEQIDDFGVQNLAQAVMAINGKAYKIGAAKRIRTPDPRITNAAH